MILESVIRWYKERLKKDGVAWKARLNLMVVAVSAIASGYLIYFLMPTTITVILLFCAIAAIWVLLREDHNHSHDR